MTRFGLVCVLLTGLAWGQTGNLSAPAPDQQQNSQASSAPASVPAPPAGHADDSLASVPPDAPVITIPGLCDYAKDGKVNDPKCKTVTTRAEFDLIMKLASPGLSTPPLRRWNARTYVDTVIKAQMALELGLDKDPDFADRVEVLRLLFYAKTLDQTLDDQEWKKVTDKEIEDYYRNNPLEFETADVTRIFLPKFPPDEKPGETLNDAEKQKRQEAWDQTLKEEAEKLHSRALAGGDFAKLQQQAYAFTGVTDIVGPTDVVLKRVRRKMFDQNQHTVMDLKPGEISPVLYDDGYYIYRMDTKSMLPLEKVRGEIHKKFQTEAIKRDKDAIQHEATVTYNEAYLGPELPEDSAPAPGAVPPQNQSQTATSK